MSKNYTTGQMKDILTLADHFAKKNTTCKKTAVGCYIVAETEWRTVLAKGCNRNPEANCKELGCLREEIYGSNSKEHRSECRCYGRHAEMDALRGVQYLDSIRKYGATAFVTRYPCLNCAKALYGAGVHRIVFGRPFPLEPETEAFLNENGVEVIHIKDWNCDENDTNN